MTFLEKDSARAKVTINNTIVEEMNRCVMSPTNMTAVWCKVGIYGHVCKIINRYVRNKTHLGTRLKYLRA